METISCPHCSSSYQIPGKRRDGTVTCLSCGQIIAEQIHTEEVPALDSSADRNLSAANNQQKREYLVVPVTPRQKPVLGGLLKVPVVPEPAELSALLNEKAKEGWIFKQCIANYNHSVNTVPYLLILERECSL